MKFYFDFICFSLSLIGAVASIWFLVGKISSFKRISWKCTEKHAKHIASSLSSDNYLPTLIVGIGRGGAIFGSLISGSLGHRPLLVIDREYVWIDGRRIDDIILKLSLPKKMLSKVLLVAGEVHTGNTMRLYHDHFLKIGSQEIRRCSFFLQKGHTEKIEYWGIESKLDRIMPWMSDKQYRRESRSQEEFNGLSSIKKFSDS